MKILFGTTNPNKLERMQKVLRDIDFEVVGLKDVGIEIEVIEDGENPGENALKKARAYHQASGLPTFAADSALYLDKFTDDEQPGLYVRRIYKDEREVSDQELLEYFVTKLAALGGESTGKWVESIALVTGPEKEWVKQVEAPTKFVSKPSPVLKEGNPLSSLQYKSSSEKYESELTPEEIAAKARTTLGEFKSFVLEHLKDITDVKTKK